MTKKIGTLLLESGLVNEPTLNSALQEQAKTGKKLGQVLVDRGVLEEKDFLKILSGQIDMPLVDMRKHEFDEDLVKKIPETQARKYRAVILEKTANGYKVGMVDPLDLATFDRIESTLGGVVDRVLISEDELENAINNLYRKTDDIKRFASQLNTDFTKDIIEENTVQATTTVDKLLRSVIEDAVQMRASDIHLEPDESGFRIRQRIDGSLTEQTMPQKNILPSMIQKLKLMAELNISEKRLPQDGRFQFKLDGQFSVDIRLSLLPTQYGEAAVMRLLRNNQTQLDFKDMGMPDRLRKSFDTALKNPHGVILVTGPTGSGKTTTLYGALRSLNQPDKKIITAEDPIEYRLERVNQVQVNTAVGLSFAKILRTMLRQDPDVIMVGEIRDQETAEIALKAAITGHLVLSTLHTNDAVNTPLRLIDMGAEAYLCASAIKGVMAQRLIKRVCPHCKEDAQPTQEHLFFFPEAEGRSFKKGAGCHYCNQSGYLGRIGVYEFLEITAPLAQALRKSDAEGFVHAANLQESYIPLSKGAYDLALQGETSLDEVTRISESADCT